MEKSLINRIIEICKDDTYDKKAKETILKELLRLFHINEMQWKRTSPSDGGEYMPEGKSIIAYDSNSGQIVIGCRYSSFGGKIMKNEKWDRNTTHWMNIPELPENNDN